MTIATKTTAGYYKLAKFCSVSITWKDGKQSFVTECDAMKFAKSPGRYRVSHVTSNGRTDLMPFEK